MAILESINRFLIDIEHRLQPSTSDLFWTYYDFVIIALNPLNKEALFNGANKASKADRFSSNRTGFAQLVP
jgi:hypothetical protein